MEQQTPHYAQIGGRTIALLYNSRCYRIIAERTGVNWLQEQADAIDAALDASSDEERNSKFSTLLAAKLRSLLANSVNQPIVVFAASQNKYNGKREEWPTWDWVEEELIPSATIMQDLMEAFSKTHGAAQSEPEQAAMGNGLPEVVASAPPAS